MQIFTKESLIEKFLEIHNRGWIDNYRNLSDGNVGNILEDLLGIDENNLKLPDAGEWEIKCQRIKCQPSSLLTLFHYEPEPRDMKVVPYLIDSYGWPHKNGVEKSFRQTINTIRYSDKGFIVQLDEYEKQVKVYKNEPNFITPYWDFSVLEEKVNLKLKNQFNVLSLSKNNRFKYSDVIALENFNFDKFLGEIKNGNVWIDFNARTKHNHGTSFRIKQQLVARLYDKVTQIL